MKKLRWNPHKNEELKATRDVSFEQILNSRLVDDISHPGKPHQRIMLYEFNNYVWVIPYVKEGEYFFLKTAFPNRKYTKEYLGGKGYEEDQGHP